MPQVPNYEKSDPAPKLQHPLTPAAIDEIDSGAGWF